MDNYGSNLPDNEKGAAYAAFMAAPPPPADPAFEFEKNTAQSYNRAAGGLLIQFAVANVIQIIVIIAAGIYYAAQGLSPTELTAKTSGIFVLLLAASISYVIGNPTGMMCGLGFTGRLKEFGGLFAKPKITGAVLFLGIFVTMGIQNISAIIQQIVSTIIGSSGTEGTILNQMVFSDDTAQNIILVLYVVFLGPIMEEFLFRGMALKNFSCSSVTFGIAMSAFAFGMFHGNIMQLIIASLLGLFWAYIDVHAGSILPSVIFHIANNGMAAITMYIDYAAPDYLEMFSMIYLIVSLVMGIAGFIIIFKKLGKPAPAKENPYAPIYEVPEGYSKNYKWSLAYKTPCVIIFTVIYVLFMIYSMLPQPHISVPDAEETAVTEEADIPEDTAAAALQIFAGDKA